MPGAGAAYALGAKQETPGVFYIGFIVSKTPRKEHMVVTGEGVYFRHEVRPIRHCTGVPHALLRAERLANAPSFAPGGTVCGLPLLLWWAVCLSMQGHTYGVSGTHACMDGMLALCPWLLSGIPSWACSPGFCSAQSFKSIEHVLSAFKKKPHGDRLTAGEDAAPPPPPAQPARVSRSVAATLQRRMSDMTAQKPCGLAACAGLDPRLFDTLRLCITVPVHNAASFCLHCYGAWRHKGAVAHWERTSSACSPGPLTALCQRYATHWQRRGCCF